MKTDEVSKKTLVSLVAVAGAGAALLLIGFFIFLFKNKISACICIGGLLYFGASMVCTILCKPKGSGVLDWQAKDCTSGCILAPFAIILMYVVGIVFSLCGWVYALEKLAYYPIDKNTKNEEKDGKKGKNDSLRAEDWLIKYGQYLARDIILPFDGKKFVFDGVPIENNGYSILELLNQKNGLVRKTVSGQTDYLVCDPRHAGNSQITRLLEKRATGQADQAKIVLIGDFFNALGTSATYELEDSYCYYDNYYKADFLKEDTREQLSDERQEYEEIKNIRGFNPLIVWIIGLGFMATPFLLLANESNIKVGLSLEMLMLFVFPAAVFLGLAWSKQKQYNQFRKQKEYLKEKLEP